MNRVAIFPSAFHPSLGGVEELTGQLADHLRKADAAAMICTNRWPRNLPSFERWKGVEVHRFPFRLPEGGLKSRLSFRLTVKNILRSVLRTVEAFGADVIHVQCVSSNAWYAWQIARLLRIPLVVSVQGERTMDAQDLYGRSPLYNRILKGVLLAADRVTACSKATLNDLSNYHGISFGNRASVVYNGVSTTELLLEAKQGSAAPYFLAMGRMVPQKGFSELLHAFGRAKTDFSLVLAGDGPELQHLKGVCAGLGLQGRVCFAGRADRARVSQLLGRASGLVVPSLREPMGIVALEGMAAGKPLLVSAVDGLQEIAPVSPWCRHVVPGDVPALARGLEWLASLETRNDAPLAGPLKWVEQFQWESITASYRRIYQEATSDCANS